MTAQTGEGIARADAIVTFTAPRPAHVFGQLTRGEVIGYVGTSGNAPPDTPHLHFAILQVGADHRWWGGRPIDPYLVLSTH